MEEEKKIIVAGNDNRQVLATRKELEAHQKKLEEQLQKLENEILPAYAKLESPAFTGIPTALTPATTTNNTQLATTNFVRTAITAYAMQDLSAYAPKASPALTGTPTAPTAAAATNNTQIATTAYVKANLASAAGMPKPQTSNSGAVGYVFSPSANITSISLPAGGTWLTWHLRGSTLSLSIRAGGSTWYAPEEGTVCLCAIKLT